MNRSNCMLSLMALAALTAGGLSRTATAQIIDPPTSGDVIVRLIPGASILEFHQRYQTATLDALPNRNIFRVTTPPGMTEDAFVDVLRNNPGDPAVRYVERNYLADGPEGTARQFFFNTVPDAAAFLIQPAWNQIDLANATPLSTGAGVTIAVLDTGVDATHAALAGRVLPDGWNFVDENADTDDVGDGVDNDHDTFIDELTGHGTHVAAIAAHVAPDALILPVRVLDSDGNSDIFDVARAIFFAIDAGVDVINASLGSTYRSDMIEDAVDEAFRRGIVVVAAVGNNNLQDPVEYPAFFDGVVRVTAVDASDVRCPFSNYHPDITISAPGSEIFSAIPGGEYAQWSGTSMATPMVAGAAALVLARRSDWPANELRVLQATSFLAQTADNVDALNDPQYAGRLGRGRLDAAAALRTPVLLEAAGSYATGAGPRAVGAADFNGDGRLDAVVANTTAGSVAVLLGQLGGGFTLQGTYPAGAGPEGVAVGDWDRDGDADVVVANVPTGVVTILWNSGGGVLATGPSLAAGVEPTSIAAADFDRDGDLDLAVADGDGSTVRLLTNNGSGSFAPGASLVVGNRPQGVVARDLDGDGDIDLATANRRSNDVAVVLNRGDGTFFAAVNYNVGPDPRTLTAGDLDGDGRPELAAASHDNGALTVLRNVGAGAFLLAGTLPLPLGAQADALGVIDLNCDGQFDLVAASSDLTAGFIAIFIGQPAALPTGPWIVPCGQSATGLTSAEFDRDQDADLVVTDALGSRVECLRNVTCT
ncbi:MAG: S8 family serine peptidase, partial [Phycisphaerae bacterium]